MFRFLSRRGFTLVELIVVVFVIAVLIALLLPMLSTTRSEPRRAQCTNNMKQLGIALHNFHDAHHRFPGSNDVPLLQTPSGDWRDVPLHTPAEPDPSVGPVEYGTNYSWITMVLPYIEETTSYQWLDTVNLRAWDTSNLRDPATGLPKDTKKPCHQMAWTHPIGSLMCPSAPGNGFCEANSAAGISTNPYDPSTPYGPAGLTNYVALGATHSDSLMGVETNPLAGGASHPNGVLYPGSKTTFKDITDGSTNTFLACETREPTLAAWYEGSTAAVFGLVGSPSFEKTDLPGAQFGQPVAGTKTTMNYGDEESNPVQYYLPVGPQGVPWVHGPSSYHPGLVNHLMGDATVHSVQEDIDPRLYMHLITRAGNEPVDEFFNQ